MTRRYHRQLQWLLAPYLLGALLLVVGPGLLSLGIAFFEYDALSAPRWSGLLNFRLILADGLFAVALRNSLALIVTAVPLRIAAAVALALLMHGGGRGLPAFRALAYLPNVIPGAAYALAWLWILNPLYGPLNLALRAIGLDPPAWLADATWAKPGLVLASLWVVGEGFLVTLAALHEIPREVEEAARVDGAGALALFRHVRLPLIAPLLLLLAFRDIILWFQDSFLFSYLMTAGGPYYSTYTLPYLIYGQAFDLFSFGTASAALWLMYGLTGAIVTVAYVVARLWGVRPTAEMALR